MSYHVRMNFLSTSLIASRTGANCCLVRLPRAFATRHVRRLALALAAALALFSQPPAAQAQESGLLGSLLGLASPTSTAAALHERGVLQVERALEAFACAAAIDEGGQAGHWRDGLAGMVGQDAVAGAQEGARLCTQQKGMPEASVLAVDRYEIGTAYAQEAFAALSCAAASQDSGIAPAAVRDRDRLAQLMPQGATAAASEAAQRCIKRLTKEETEGAKEQSLAENNAEGDQPLAPRLHRPAWLKKIVFAPGDAIVLGAFGLANELRITFVSSLINDMVVVFGDLLTAGLSIAVWFLGCKLILLLISRSPSGRGATAEAQGANGVGSDKDRDPLLDTVRQHLRLGGKALSKS